MTGPNHGGGLSVPLYHTVDICTVNPKKDSGRNTGLIYLRKLK